MHGDIDRCCCESCVCRSAVERGKLEVVELLREWIELETPCSFKYFRVRIQFLVDDRNTIKSSPFTHCDAAECDTSWLATHLPVVWTGT